MYVSQLDMSPTTTCFRREKYSKQSNQRSIVSNATREKHSWFSHSKVNTRHKYNISRSKFFVERRNERGDKIVYVDSILSCGDCASMDDQDAIKNRFSSVYATIYTPVSVHDDKEELLLSHVDKLAVKFHCALAVEARRCRCRVVLLSWKQICHFAQSDSLRRHAENICAPLS